ncbi:MAG: dihydrofolate reductase [Bauldia sp.]|nr:dihydrofolate reductase [Bauldia sp.]
MTGSPVSLALIAAVADNGVIGDGGCMPWRLSSDLRRFKALTMGRPIVMGRRTFDSIGKPLAGRTNIVVTRNSGFRAEGVIVAADLTEALDAARRAARNESAAEVFVVGGGEIYRQAMASADRLHITHVHARPAGDVTFPPIDAAVWERVSAEDIPAGDKDSAPTTYAVYRRRGVPSR